jgi:two-component system NtrC family sensor kinase
MAVTGRIILMELNMVFGILFIVYLVRISFFKSVLVRFYVIGALWLVVFSALGVLGVTFSFISPFPVGQLGQILIYAGGLAYKMKMNEKARAEAQIVKTRNAELSKALEDLKAAQTQLVQSEKMASLGELTAGIAHEIQNPLNFVNNFSEVNSELIAEMKEAIHKDNKTEATELASNIDENEKKITMHGKRAEAIVKSMLHHSRSNSGTKEPTDINELAEEYLRLSYHGLRAKDKNFNAGFETELDPGIGKIQVIPQDLGRVLLNLFNNAFYYVMEKKKTFQCAEGGVEYEPMVTVTTRKKKNSIEIIVGDNGNGVPIDLRDKIFQPFFTTKPTGQGTGLGLSLSYDIIKAHGGQIKLETREGEGTEFIIELPLS